MDFLRSVHDHVPETGLYEGSDVRVYTVFEDLVPVVGMQPHEKDGFCPFYKLRPSGLKLFLRDNADDIVLFVEPVRFDDVFESLHVLAFEDDRIHWSVASEIPVVRKIRPAYREKALDDVQTDIRPHVVETALEHPGDEHRDEVRYKKRDDLAAGNLGDPVLRDMKGIVYPPEQKVQDGIDQYNDPVALAKKIVVKIFGIK